MEEEEILDEISCQDIQSILNQMLGGRSFSFTEYVSRVMQGKLPFSVQEMVHSLFQGLASGMEQEKKIYFSLMIIGLLGALLSNFTGLLQGNQVADMAFYGVYILFFTLLMQAFLRSSALAQNTLTGLLDFIKVLCPAYFISMSFSQ